MPDDRDDDDTPPAGSKSSRGPKKRFQERDDRDDEDDDRPRKKRRSEDDEDEDRPSKRKRADDEDEDDRPKKKRRVIVDDGPRVKSNDNIPVVMLLAFIGSAVALFVICAGCGWFSFDWLVLGGTGGGGGNDFQVLTASRQPGVRLNDPPTVAWSVKSHQNPSGGGQYYLIMKAGNGQPVAKPITPAGKGGTISGGGPEQALRMSSGRLDVWVEKRPNPVANGKVVSNVYTVP